MARRKEQENRHNQLWLDALVVSTDEDEIPVLVKGPQVSSIGTLLSGDSEE